MLTECRKCNITVAVGLDGAGEMYPLTKCWCTYPSLPQNPKTKGTDQVPSAEVNKAGNANNAVKAYEDKTNADKGTYRQMLWKAVRA